MREWKRQRTVYENRESADLQELGFATLFLNRTNRSGVLSGGVIGGKRQTGEWGIDARFTREALVSRIQKISRCRRRINLYQRDVLEFTNEVIPTLGRNAFLFYDPPYIENGSALYLDEYDVDDHRRLAQSVMKLAQPWIITYDYSAIQHKLYSGCRRVVYDLEYVAQARYAGREVLFVSDHLQIPRPSDLIGPKMRLVRHE